MPEQSQYFDCLRFDHIVSHGRLCGANPPLSLEDKFEYERLQKD